MKNKLFFLLFMVLVLISGVFAFDSVLVKKYNVIQGTDSNSNLFLNTLSVINITIPSVDLFVDTVITSGVNNNINTDLIVRYSFTGDLTDDSGNSHTLTNSGTSSTTDKNGVSDQARNFNNNYAQVSDTATLEAGSALTVSMWIQYNSGATGRDTMLCKWVYPTQGSWCFALDNSKNELIVFTAKTLGDAGNTYAYTTTANLQQDTWYHIGFVYDGSGSTNADKLQIFIDGNPISTSYAGTLPTSLLDSSAPLSVGVFDGLGRTWNGKMDEINIYDKVVSDSDMLELYNIYDSYSGTDTTYKIGFNEESPDAHYDFKMRDLGVKGVKIEGVTGQTMDYFHIADSSNTEVFSVDQNGDVDIKHNLVIVGDLKVGGNINVSGCVIYNGGTLGSCI